ncbi:MAG: rod shape-determining protein MreC [Chitinophagaceae bacterium]|nr:rod shape-determining protein MreC [Chitinophagaceae bacterium]
MRNIFLFIRRYFNFLFFVLAQVIALLFLFRYNRFHEAAFMNVATEGTGWFGSKYDNVQYYFNLKKTNEDLAKENELLRNQLLQNYSTPDSNAKLVRDSIPVDTLGNLRLYAWRGAKVVNNSVSLQNNYLTIHRGEKQGVKKDMGVISPTGIVGTVINTSDNYAVVMSVLHRQNRVSAKMKKSGRVGTVQWDGESPLYVTMINVPKSEIIAKGDSVVTSQYSYLFPQGIMVGTVSEIVDDKTSNFYTLRLKPATDFHKVEYVTVVENIHKDEQKKLEEATKKNQ